MSLNNAKRFTATTHPFLILLLICSTTVFAQDADRRQVASSERQSKLSEIAPPTDGKIFPGEILNRKNFEDSASNYYFRPKIKIDARDEEVIFERKIVETGESKPGADVFAAPKTKSNVGSSRFRESSIGDPAKNSRRVSQPNVFAGNFSRYFRPPANSSSKSFSFNQATGQPKKVENIYFPASQTRGANSFYNFYKNADAPESAANKDDPANKTDDSFRWGSAIKQSLAFLAIQHGYAFTQPKTREAIKGKFWKDYAESVKSLRGWADGGRFFTNYIAHPMQGAFLGYIQIQNDPKGLKQQFGSSGDYWRSRLKAMAWSAVWSTQFEIGPVSQASIGNVGLNGKQTYIDIVITPTVGTAWLIFEDAIDRLLMKRIERGTDNFYAVIFSRMLLSPTRTVANIFRFKTPWYRDRPRAR